eukprot:731535-Pyramimonas_sp.AAC.1
MPDLIDVKEVHGKLVARVAEGMSMIAKEELRHQHHHHRVDPSEGANGPVGSKRSSRKANEPEQDGPALDASASEATSSGAASGDEAEEGEGEQAGQMANSRASSTRPSPAKPRRGDTGEPLPPFWHQPKVMNAMIAFSGISVGRILLSWVDKRGGEHAPMEPSTNQRTEPPAQKGFRLPQRGAHP